MADFIDDITIHLDRPTAPRMQRIAEITGRGIPGVIEQRVTDASARYFDERPQLDPLRAATS